ncbi:unnamed protein product [Closterium sp. Yama58-4]|nr:unnamed protein product [Closterium sp. Yama58-4]
MLLGFVLVLALSCGPQDSEGARARRLLTTHDEKDQGLRWVSTSSLSKLPRTVRLERQSLIGQSLHAPGYSGAPRVLLLVRREAPLQRKLLQPEQQVQNLRQVARRIMLNLWKKQRRPKKQQEQKKQGKEEQLQQPAPAQGDGNLGDTSNFDFSEVVGMKGEEARKYIQASAPQWNVAVIPSGAMITGDFREDRVRVFVDKAGIVQRTQVG